ncbi:hypothetical protein VE02_08657 [Pseudogymnoascus sp. 03VT05]|nr:hypothetical protein VE02_08657 [Pseudogymnoascus sp. 03VT05]
MLGFTIKHLFCYKVCEALLNKLITNYNKYKNSARLKTFKQLTTVANKAVKALGLNAGLFLKGLEMAKEGKRDSEDL